MPHEAAHHTHPYDLESYDAYTQERVLVFSRERRKLHPVTRPFIARFFGMSMKTVSLAEIRYMEEYARLADTELVLGAAFGPNARGPVSVRLSKENPLLYSRRSYWHDMAHSIVARWEYGNSVSLESLLPAYLKERMEGPELYLGRNTHNAHFRIWQRQHAEETIALRIFGGVRFADLSKHLHSFENEDAFLESFAEVSSSQEKYPVPPHLERNLRRIYREFKSDNGFLFRLFAESTLPLMEKYAPNVAAALKEKYQIERGASQPEPHD